MTEAICRRWLIRFALAGLLLVVAAIGQRENISWVLPYLQAVTRANPIIMAALLLVVLALIPFNFQEASADD